MDEHNTDQERLEIVKDFIQKLADSGYTHQNRQEIKNVQEPDLVQAPNGREEPDS